MSGLVYALGDGAVVAKRNLIKIKRVPEVLVFVPSVSNFRRQWLMERLAAAQIAALAAEGTSTVTGIDIISRGYEHFIDKITGGRVPKEYIPGVEKGLTNAKETGVIAGFPVIDLKCTLIDGGYWLLDGGPTPFQLHDKVTAADTEIDEPGLVVPHPRMARRASPHRTAPGPTSSRTPPRKRCGSAGWRASQASRGWCARPRRWRRCARRSGSSI